MSDYKKPLIEQKDPQYKTLLNSLIDGHMSFSFEFFREIDYFGLGDCGQQWFRSLLEAIYRYSTMKLSDIRGKDSFRYHSIDWMHKNIPIKFSDLNWLPRNEQFLVDPQEIYQLSISTGMGRIIGFTVGSTFYIVLLDPKHNLQPSKRHNYQVTQTTIGETQYEELKRKYDLLYKWAHDKIDKKQAIELSSPQNNILYVSLSDDVLNNYMRYCYDTSIPDLIDEHTYHVLEQNKE